MNWPSHLAISLDAFSSRHIQVISTLTKAIKKDVSHKLSISYKY